jgi:hypothetical protein
MPKFQQEGGGLRGSHPLKSGTKHLTWAYLRKINNTERIRRTVLLSLVKVDSCGE